MIGRQDILIAIALGIIFFGAKKLPDLARGLGESLKAFKKATTQADEPPASPTPPTGLPASGGPTRPCPNCQTALRVEWAHCLTCGATVPAAFTGARGSPTPLQQDAR